MSCPRPCTLNSDKAVKAACDAAGTEITPQQVFDLFKKEYIDVDGPYQILKMKYYDEGAEDGSAPTAAL